MEVLLKRHTLTVDQYHQIFEAGIITEKDKVELVRGEIIAMSPKGSKHSFYVKRITDLFYERLRQQVVVSVQDPIQLDDYSESEPDIALSLPPLERYLDQHPKAKEVFLLVEVASSSLEYDKQIKLPLYAEAGIPEVWIVDIANREIIVAKDPNEGIYSSLVNYSVDNTLKLSIRDHAFSIPVAKILSTK